MSDPFAPPSGLTGTPPLSILMVASEAFPFAKTGGLADVVGALPGALRRLGHRVTVVVPRYREVGPLGAAQRRLDIVMGGRRFEVGLIEAATADGGRTVFVECAELYDRIGLYGRDGVDHPDNAVRFGVLCRAALDEAAHWDTPPAVVHAHDWQTGLVPVLLRTRHATDPRWRSVPSVFTIHNLAYQGLFPPETLQALDLDRSLFTIDGVEFWNQVGLLKAGIAFADGITAVSPTYSRQLLSAEHGEGLDGLLRHRRHLLAGIVNGIDVDAWDPRTDRWLPAPYSVDDLTGKRAAKRELLRRYGLPSDGSAAARPLVGMVSRMVDQKGLDLIWHGREALCAMDAAFVVLGTGEPRYEAMWRALAAAHPTRVGVRVGFDEGLAHLIEAGADLFLMPSRFEPCGLNQMYSMRYGTVPVVRATGGLADTVRQVDPQRGVGTGFMFEEYTAAAMLSALNRALVLFRDQERWRVVQRAGMRQDFSWDSSAAAYVQVYQTAIARRQALGARGETARGTESGEAPA